MRFFGFELPRERFFWIVLAVILVALVLVFAWRNVVYENQLASAKQRDKALSDQVERIKDSLKQKEALLQRRPELATQLPTVYDWDIRRLQKKGLQDPIKDVVDDLMKHPELIPHEGVLGGQMGFYPGATYVLTAKWVLAYFEDGHIAGHMLLEYQVSPGGKISWRVIDSYVMQ